MMENGNHSALHLWKINCIKRNMLVSMQPATDKCKEVQKKKKKKKKT